MGQNNLPITKLPVGAVPANVMVCGDPARALKTAERFDRYALLSENREYVCYAGEYQGTAVAVCSHGVGAAGAAVAFEELIAAGAQRLIRIGTCGGIQPYVTDGDLVIATAALSYTGYTAEVAPPRYPPVADPHLAVALAASAKRHGHPHHLGLIVTRDTFYPGVTTPFTADYAQLQQANILAVEMECAALFVVGSLRQVPTAAILAVDGNVFKAPESMESYRPDRSIVAEAVEAEIEIALVVIKGYTSTQPPSTGEESDTLPSGS